MSLSSTYTLPERNDPCPCGSGKKYKKCCYLNQPVSPYNPEEKLHMLDKFNHAVTELPGYEQILTNLVEPRLKTSQKDGEISEELLSQIMEATYFEGEWRGKPIRQLALKQIKTHDADRKAIEEMVARSQWGFYLIKQVVLGERFLLQKIGEQEPLTVWEHAGTMQMRQGMMIATRLIPCGSDWQMTGLAQLIPEPMQYVLSRNPGVMSALNQLAYVDMLTGSTKTPTSNNPIIKKLEAEAEKSRQEVDPLERPGPKEEILVRQLMQEAQKKELPPVPSVRQKYMDSFTQKWLNKPQSELGGQTPKQAILAERQNLGNPNTIVAYKAEVRSLEDPEEDGYNQALYYQKQGQWWEALAGYAKLARQVADIPENYRFFANVGSALAYLGFFAEAKTLMHKALRVNPDYELAQRNLVAFDNKQKMREEAPKAVRRLWAKTYKSWKNLPWNENIPLIRAMRQYILLCQRGQMQLTPRTLLLNKKSYLSLLEELTKIDTVVFPPRLEALATQLGLVAESNKYKLQLITKRGTAWLSGVTQEAWVKLIKLWWDTPPIPDFLDDKVELSNPAWIVLAKLASEIEKISWTIEELVDDWGVAIDQTNRRERKERIATMSMVIIPELMMMGIVTITRKVEVTNYGRELMQAMMNESRRALPGEIWELTSKE